MDSEVRQKRGRKRQRDSDEDSDDSTEPSAAKRQSHNVAEKRRRDKINIKLAELRSLLPNAKASQSKATTLHAAVELLDSLEHEHTRLWELNQSLTTENRYLQGLAKATAAEIPVTPISPVIKHENGLKPSIDAPRGDPIKQASLPAVRTPTVPLVGGTPTIPRLPLPGDLLSASTSAVNPAAPSAGVLPPFPSLGLMPFATDQAPKPAHGLPMNFPLLQQPLVNQEQLQQLQRQQLLMQHSQPPFAPGQLPQILFYVSGLTRPTVDNSFPTEEQSFQPTAGEQSQPPENDEDRGRNRGLRIPRASRSRSPSPRQMSRIEPLTPIFQTGPRPVASVDPSASRFLQVPSLAPATSPSPPRSPPYFPRSPTGSLFMNGTPPLSPNHQGPPLSPTHSNFNSMPEHYFDQLGASPLNLSPRGTSPTPSILGDGIFMDIAQNHPTSAFSRTRSATGRNSLGSMTYPSGTASLIRADK